MTIIWKSKPQPQPQPSDQEELTGLLYYIIGNYVVNELLDFDLTLEIQNLELFKFFMGWWINHQTDYLNIILSNRIKNSQ